MAEMIKVEIWLNPNSGPIVRDDVIMAYDKGPFFVLQRADRFEKYPIANIWRVVQFG